MYPFLRLAGEFWIFRNAPALPVDGVHVSHHTCMPWDIDFWGELNNGRALTLYDLGRTIMAKRTGLLALLKREGWAVTVAGSSVRYRKRVRMFDRIEMRSRCVGWDEKFFYIEQGMWRGEDCTSHILIRAAVSDRNGLVRTDRVEAAYGAPLAGMQPPGWVRAWCEAEVTRPWPPMADAGNARHAA